MKLFLPSFLAALLLGLMTISANAATPPKIGDKAPDFSLKTLDDQTVTLSQLTATGKVVVVVLRGWPGYQCPACTRQVREFTALAEDFASAKTQVVLIYPGPADKLKEHAKEFSAAGQFPKNFHFVLDPEYTMVNDYDLRWDAKNETAYPSTFVVDRHQTVRYAKISHEHGGRADAKEVVKAAGAAGE